MCSFNQKLAYKAERAGKLFVQVDSKHTSQICHRCGNIAGKSLSERSHDCKVCGYHDTRDHASSLVILERRIEKVRSERPDLKLADSSPLHPSVHGLQVSWMKREAPLERAEWFTT